MPELLVSDHNAARPQRLVRVASRARRKATAEGLPTSAGSVVWTAAGVSRLKAKAGRVGGEDGPPAARLSPT